MTPRRVAIGKGVIALSVIALVLVALLGFVLLTSQSMVKTVTLTTTVIPTQQAVEMVSGSFSQHMLQLGSGNVSAVVSEYERNANVTWIGKTQCYGGFYNGTFFITELMNAFLVQTAPALVIGNVTMTTTAEANGSVVVNSAFGFASHGGSSIDGIVNGTVSAQDSYTYSTTNAVWLISQETWDFITFNTQFPACRAG